MIRCWNAYFDACRRIDLAVNDVTLVKPRTKTASAGLGAEKGNKSKKKTKKKNRRKDKVADERRDVNSVRRGKKIYIKKIRDKRDGKRWKLKWRCWIHGVVSGDGSAWKDDCLDAAWKHSIYNTEQINNQLPESGEGVLQEIPPPKKTTSRPHLAAEVGPQTARFWETGGCWGNTLFIKMHHNNAVTQEMLRLLQAVWHAL